MSEARRHNMQANRRRDTSPELRLRRALHARGLRYRCDFRLSIAGRLIRPDIVFTRLKVAVFVDGCFWHGCPLHSRPPRRNGEYWSPKLARNKERDIEQTSALETAGWLTLRVWEHERVDDATKRVLEVLAART